MKTVKVVAAVIKALNQEGEPIIFAAGIRRIQRRLGISGR